MSADATKPVARELAEGDDPRQLAGRIVQALYRLVKGCFLHDDANQAIAALIELVTDSTKTFCAKSGLESAAVLFAGNSVFVNKQMLRASRETYQLALELGTILAGCNITEVTVERGVAPTSLAEFGRAVAAMHREKTPSPHFTDGGWPGLKVRKVVGFGGSEALSPVTRVARTYAASIMIVRGFYAELKKGKFELSHSVKRVAQKLAGIPEDEKRLLLSTAAAPAADADRAGLIVSSAVIAVLMAGQLTDDRSALTSLATAALLYDAGRVRLTRGSGTDGPVIERVLNEDEEERLPNASLIALTALGKLHPPSVTRSVIVYEALALRNEATVPYGGARQPHVLSRILAVARAFTELRVARGSSAPLSIDDAIQVLSSQARDNTEKTFVKLLVGTLGVFPAGTLVELSTGELAVVVSTPRLPVDFARPPVRIMYDPNGAVLEEPIDVDLATARASDGEALRFIRKPIDASDQQMKQMRAYVMSLTAKRKKSSDKNRIDRAQLDARSEAKPAEPKPRPDRPLPRRRLSAPQAAIPAALQALQDTAEQQRISVDIVGATPEIEPDEIVEIVEVADLEPRKPPPPPNKRFDAAKAERANAEPELSFESIELSAPGTGAPPSVAAQASPPSSASAVSSGRPARAAVRRWDPRSEDEPPEGAAPEASKRDLAAPASEAPISPPPASPKVPAPAASPPARRNEPSMRPTPSVPIPAVRPDEKPQGDRPAGAVTGKGKPIPPRPTVPKVVAPEIRIPEPEPEAAASSASPMRRASGSTRQVSWTEYGKEIVEAVGVPEPSPSETDAILAAYLSEEAAGGESNESVSRSAGLRWGAEGGGQSSGGHVTGAPSTGGHATGHVTGRPGARPTNTGGLRWEGRSNQGTSSPGRDMAASSPGREVGASSQGREVGASSQGREIGSSSPGRDARSSGGVRWGTSSQGRSATGAERATPVSRQGQADGVPSSTGGDSTPSLRGRAKAGSQAWGNPRRDKK